MRLLGLGFLALLGVVAAEATQAVGALLLLGLVAAPAGAAHRLARSPYAGLALSTAFAVGAVWLGLAFSYVEASVPPSTAIICRRHRGVRPGRRRRTNRSSTATASAASVARMITSRSWLLRCAGELTRVGTTIFTPAASPAAARPSEPRRAGLRFPA